MPVLYLLAGPNGTGKTTFYSTAVQIGLIDETLPFINVDLITKRLGGYTSVNYLQAQEIYRDTVGGLLKKQCDFMIETNLAESSNYEWIGAMKKAGYDVILFYLSTNNVETNIQRVLRRVQEGGHDIPEPIIRSRYTQSHSYLKTKLHTFSKVYLIDNSLETFEIEVELHYGNIVFKSPSISNWINEVMSVVERLKNNLR